MDAAARALPPGGLARVHTATGRCLGIAGINRHALIAGRMLSQDVNVRIDTRFLARRLRAALALRDALFDQPFYRLVHSEADGLPGLVVDRFDDVVVAQLNTATTDALRGPILEALDEVLRPSAVVFRNDGAARAIEGLPSAVEVAVGRIEQPIGLIENDCRFLADPVSGQKTGWFYDQRDNRAFAARLAAGRSVLDVYCHTGGFAIPAARAGAEHVVAVDRSAPALELAEAGARATEVADRIAFVRADAFADLEERREAGERFGLVIVDPPAFVKSRKTLKSGARGYRKLSKLAARLVAAKGFLLIGSCSHHVGPELFAEQVGRGLVDARRSGRVLRAGGAAADHPVHPLLPESAYLKVLVLQLD